jgi:hypothetical protein
VIEMIEHLGGLQAQAPFPPYYGLWSRLAGFRPDDLAELLVSRQVVRIALMRGTIHLVSAGDCLALRPLIQPVMDRALTTVSGKQLAGMDTGALASAGRALVEEKPRTFSELGSLLSPHWPGHTPAALAQGVRALVPLVQVPPRAVWARPGAFRRRVRQPDPVPRRPLPRHQRPRPAAPVYAQRRLPPGPSSSMDSRPGSGGSRGRAALRP